MLGFEWRRAPAGHDTTSWGPLGNHRTVLVVVNTTTGGQHLLDVARLLESDPRVKVAYTVDSDVFDKGVERLLRDVSAVVVPWRQATAQEFGLVIGTSLTPLRQLRGPSIVMPFGERIEVAAKREMGHPKLSCATGGHHVIHYCGAGPTSIVLSHEAEVARLVRAYPETLPLTTVAGDPSYDRLTASLPLRDFYRRALGVGSGQRLVVVIARRPWPGQTELLARLPAELPVEEYQVIALFPPDNGAGGVDLADCIRRGLRVLPPEGDWRAALVAADWIIDDGAVGPYGVITGVPVLLSGVRDADIAPGSALAELVRIAPRLSAHRSIARQLHEAAVRHRPERHQAVLERITSEPGRFNRNIRSLVYRLLDLRQPLSIPTTDPVSPPFHLD